MRTRNAEEFFAEVMHPISPSNMRTFVYQLVRDNALDRARELAGVMVAWAHLAPGDEHFYYWLGVEQTMRALADGAMDRWRVRSDRKFERTRRICEAAIARGGKAAS